MSLRWVPISTSVFALLTTTQRVFSPASQPSRASLEGQDETCVIKHRMEDMAGWGEPGYHNSRTLRLDVTSAVTWRKKSYYKLGSVTETHASGRRIQIYALDEGSAGSVTMAMQKRQMSCETSLGGISSSRSLGDGGSVGITQRGGRPPAASALGAVVITHRRVGLRLL